MILFMMGFLGYVFFEIKSFLYRQATPDAELTRL